MSMEVGSSNAYLANPSHSWWSSQTSKEKKLLVVCGIVSILAIIFFICTIALGVKKGEAVQDPVQDKTYKTCTTKECKEIALQLILNMNEDMDPCDNFYDFACGGFKQFHGVNDSTPTLAEIVLETQIQTILQGKPEDQKNNAAKSVLYLYDKCLNQGSDPKGTESVKNLIFEILGSPWPIAFGKSWRETDFNSVKSMAKMMQIDPEFFLQLSILPDKEDYTQLSPWLEFEKMTINLPPNIEDIVCEVYEKCTPDELEDDIKVLNESVNDVKEPELFVMGKLSSWPEEGNNKILKSSPEIIKTYRKLTIKEIASETPDMPEATWKDFFQTLLPGQVDDNFKVILEPQFPKRLSAFQMNKRKLANLIGLRLVQLWGKRYSNNIIEYWDPTESRADICYSFVDQTLGFALAKMHTDSYMLPNVIQEMETLNKEILNSFKQLVNEASWLETSTRERAIKKVNNLEYIVVFPKWALEKDSLEKYYKDVEPVKENNFVDGSRLAIQNYFKQQVQQIGTKMDRKNYWPPTPKALVNAMYFSLTNSMYYFRGIVMKPFFAPGRPRVVNYGTIAVTIGHEITHGFDSKGKSYDENGLVNNWWDPITEYNYQEKAKCLIDQYSAITDELTNKKLNGIATLAENIADGGGLRASFMAYKNSPPDYKLVGLEKYTDDQLFFISAAQFFCNNDDADRQTWLINNDEHSLDRYRVLVPNRNFQEFSNAFHCKKGSNMNPEIQCRIW